MLPNIGNFVHKILCTMKTTSVALGNHFESFVSSAINSGRFNNASEVVRAGLRLLEENEAKIAQLKLAIEEGESSGICEDFDFDKFVENLKQEQSNG